MRFISLQENLKRALNIVGHVTSKNINLPILNNVLIKSVDGNIEFISTNLEIGITHQLRGKIDVDGEFTVDSKLITEYVALLNGKDNVKIEEKDNELKLECGNYKTRIKGESAKEFPLIPTISKDHFCEIKIDTFRKALNSVIFAVSSSENRLELSGVLFSFNRTTLSLAATDSYRLAERIIEVNNNLKEDEYKVIVPAKTVLEFLRVLNNFVNKFIGGGEGLVKIYLSDNQILFNVDSVDLISRLINGHYPDYKQIIPIGHQTSVSIDKAELIRAVKATSLFSKTGINDIALFFSKDKILVSAFSGQSGESKVELEAEVAGINNEITINYRYLLDGLNNIEGSFIKMNLINSNTPCLIKSETDNNYLYIVMPIKQ